MIWADELVFLGAGLECGAFDRQTSGEKDSELQGQAAELLALHESRI